MERYDYNNATDNQSNFTNFEEGYEPTPAKTSFIFNLCYDFGLLTLVNLKRFKRVARKGLKPLIKLAKKSPHDLSRSKIKGLLDPNDRYFHETDGNFARKYSRDVLAYVPKKPKAKAKLNPQVIARKAAVCIAPLMAILIFAVSMQTFDASALALEVELNGKVIGIVENESTFSVAFDDIYERIADDSIRYNIDRNTNFSVVRVSPRRVGDVSQIQANILDIALPDLIEASILHVDGHFVAAAEDDEIIRDILDEMLNGYDGGEDVVRVQFYNEISISRGFYVDGGLSDVDDMRQTLNSPIVVGVDEETIVVDAPATVMQVAAMAAACPNIILQINPELRNGGSAIPAAITLDAGTEVVVGYEERPLLTIKSIRNTTIERDIPYSTVETPYNGLIVGRSQTTQAGRVGRERVVEEIIYVAGVELNRNVVNTEVLTEPTTRQVLIGSHRPTPAPLRPATVHDTPVEIAGQMRFSYPVNNVRVSSRWGAGRGHRGWDFLGPIGTNIYSAADGVVTFSGSNRGYGRFVIIDHGNGYSTLYAHNRVNDVVVGQRVVQGEKIAEIGMTGHTTGPHVHFEIRINGRPVDPARYFN